MKRIFFSFPLYCLQHLLSLIRFSQTRILVNAASSPLYWLLSSTILAVAHSLMYVRVVVCHVGIGKAGLSCGTILTVLSLKAPFFFAWAAWFSNVLASEVFENRAKMKSCFFLSHISIRVLLGILSPLSLKVNLTWLKRFRGWTLRSWSLPKYSVASLSFSVFGSLHDNVYIPGGKLPLVVH